ncbi:helix-turn-helix transcriptional regulator [Buttiauxella gaviniae]|uniref:helix-turn-helix transcriptional regulator n=1 Tax=Buttiauxella gaviniae TaxID=82990 RepID=UPI003C7238CB
MLTIAIDDKDAFYRHGMEILLQDIFLKENFNTIHIDKLTVSNSINVDVIIKSFVPGEEYVCHPLLKFRNKSGLIIGVYDSRKKPELSELPICIKNIVFISRNESINQVRQTVIESWRSRPVPAELKFYRKCLHCCRRTFTDKQYAISRLFIRGYNIKQIACNLDVSVKIVSGHKRLIMVKFNLDSDAELVTFLHNMRTHNPPVNLYLT